ncbi:MAG TPA: ABC transporter substrate-binding protein [Streptosporangiaceae bacterium]|nr:ABC transporter substrate-binding protein [Streptosporangiaceae bacterium]
MGCSLGIVTGVIAGCGRDARLSRPRLRRRLSAVALAACSAVAAACSSGTSSSTAASAHTPVKVGYLLPLTGIFTKNGTSEQNGFKLGLKHFGTSVDGHPIQVTYANDQGDPTVSLSMARQLVTSRHVQVMEGPLISSAIAVVAPYVLGKGIPEDDLYLASPQQALAYNRYGTGFTSGWDGFAPSTVGAKWAYTTMGWRHVTTVGLDISFGWQGVGGFAAQFTKLGGKIDKMIWVPSNAVDMSSYVSAIPAGTQAVWVVLSGSQAASFVNTYASFGLKKKIPLMGITTLTDQAALPAEKPSAALGVYTDSQYCDGNPAAVNQQFANAYHAAYGVYPSYYSEAGYTKAEILIAALKSLHGVVTSEKALGNAMRAVKITAPRGPVSLNRATWSPVQNEYICKVENVDGTMRNVPILTVRSVPPWGTLSLATWTPLFARTAVSQPSP